MSETKVATLEEATRRAREDHAGALGKVIEVDFLCGYVGGDSCDWQCRDPRFKVRVLPTDDADVVHVNFKFVDPYWNCELVEPHPRIPAEARSFWCDGPSYRFEDRKGKERA